MFFVILNAADSLSLPLCPGGVRIPVSTIFFREFAGQDSDLGRPLRDPLSREASKDRLKRAFFLRQRPGTFRLRLQP